MQGLMTPDSVEVHVLDAKPGPKTRFVQFPGGPQDGGVNSFGGDVQGKFLVPLHILSRFGRQIDMRAGKDSSIIVEQFQEQLAVMSVYPPAKAVFVRWKSRALQFKPQLLQIYLRTSPWHAASKAWLSRLAA